MVLLDFGTGLRRGQLSGAKWAGIDFKVQVLRPSRSTVAQCIGNVKTDGSAKAILLDAALIEELREWRVETPYSSDSDYVFASWKMKGKQPLWMSRRDNPSL